MRLSFSPSHRQDVYTKTFAVTQIAELQLNRLFCLQERRIKQISPSKENSGCGSLKASPPCTVYKGTEYGVYKLPRREMVPCAAPSEQLLCVLLLLGPGWKDQGSE